MIIFLKMLFLYQLTVLFTITLKSNSGYITEHIFGWGDLTLWIGNLSRKNHQILHTLVVIYYT